MASCAFFLNYCPTSESDLSHFLWCHWTFEDEFSRFTWFSFQFLSLVLRAAVPHFNITWELSALMYSPSFPFVVSPQIINLSTQRPFLILPLCLPSTRSEQLVQVKYMWETFFFFFLNHMFDFLSYIRKNCLSKVVVSSSSVLEWYEPYKCTLGWMSQTVTHGNIKWRV